MNIGYIGVGWPDRGQILAFTEAGFIPTAICSKNIENAKKVAQKYQIPKIYNSWESMIDDSEIDLFSITTPPWLHYQICKKMIANNKNFICESPFLNSHEVVDLIELIKQKPNRIRVVDFELRFSPCFEYLKSLIKANELGNIIQVEVNYIDSFNLSALNVYGWENDKIKGGGVLNLIGAHYLDLIKWLFGDYEIIHVGKHTAYDQRSDLDGNLTKVTAEDYVNIFLKTDKQIIGNIIVNTIQGFGVERSICVTGSKKSIYINTEHIKIIDSQKKVSEIKLKEINEFQLHFKDKNLHNEFVYGSVNLAKEIYKVMESRGNYKDLPGLNDMLFVQKILEKSDNI